MHEDAQSIDRMFFAGLEIMGPKKWFKRIVKLKKRKEDKLEQAKVFVFL